MLVPSAFAATHDATEDVSTNTATLVLGKDLTYTNRQHSPISKVTYTIEKVEAWGNDAVANGTNGAAIAVAEMPNPSTSSAEINLTDNGNGKATGTTTVTIPFTKAGYYVYKIKETAIANPGNRATVTSDTHEYFAVIYVCNRTDANGNTASGVYVHDITSYRNTSGSDTYKPTLTDIANTTDNGGTAASANTEANLGKVGKSTPTDPNSLEAYKMWNTVAYPTLSDLTISKNVTGNLGDLTKKFSFTVSLTGLEPSSPYAVDNTGDVTMTKGTFANGTMTATAAGEIAFTVLLRDDQSVKINDVPQDTAWTVTEAASNHKASYAITPAASATGDATKANANDNTSLSASGTVEGDTVCAYTNNRTLATITGVPNGVPETMIALIVAGLVAVMFAIRKRSREDERYIESLK